jgi:hypothetical protein
MKQKQKIKGESQIVTLQKCAPTLANVSKAPTALNAITELKNFTILRSTRLSFAPLILIM